MIEIRWDLNREQQLYDQRKQLLLICHLKNSKKSCYFATKFNLGGKTLRYRDRS